MKALARMQTEEAEAQAEKNKKIEEKLERYKREEEELENQRQKQLEDREKALQAIFYFIMKNMIHNETYGKATVDPAVEFKTIFKLYS